MVHADREKPQPVEVISGRHFNIFFLLVVLFNDHRAHINIVSQNAPLLGEAAWGCWGWGVGWEGCHHFALHLQYSCLDVPYLYLCNVFFLFAHPTRALYSIF